jgi:hypothetical protein
MESEILRLHREGEGRSMTDYSRMSHDQREINRLEKELETARAELQHYEQIKADLCECNHSLIAHVGHAHSIGSEPPTHCARCTCHKFRSKSLIKELEMAQQRITALSDALKDANYFICKHSPAGCNDDEHGPICRRIKSVLAPSPHGDV